MKALLLLLSVLSSRTRGSHLVAERGSPDEPDRVPVRELRLDLSAALHRLDPRFLSVTIDASLAAEERFMLLLRSQKIRTLAGALSPAFVRFGGTRQDFMVFDPVGRQDATAAPPADDCGAARLPAWLEGSLKQNWTQQLLLLQKEEQQREYRRTRFTELTVDQLQSFSSCCGLDLIFGLNALLRTPRNSWNSSNAAALLRYCEARRYRMSWELGNEPNSFEKKAGIRVDGGQLGRDFTRLRTMLSQSSLYRDAGLFGPDVGQPRDHRADILGGFLQSGGGAIDACTWHHYYVNGREASLENFLDPEILDSLAVKTSEVLETVKEASPGTPVWLGETSSAFGGGAPGLSDSFVAGFMWLDKLGVAARMGLGVVMRQVLVGAGSYHLLDDDLNPLPDFWLSVLHKRLVGPEVLKVETVSEDGDRRVRSYLHCASRKSYRDGAVVLMSMNLGQRPVRMRVPVPVSNSTVETFVLQSDRPGEDGLRSRSVKLNGVLLEMLDDETLPRLSGAPLPPSDHLQLPAYSLAFFVFTDAGAAACH
ncbi:heparanase [Oryzias melastigma]|uniref:Heparanase n=1 Tax=Oryzias melastigma TaxID=30732 RepID=A0A3B3D4F8_ORYME|nr:heparanase [Oryzias melastigma]